MTSVRKRISMALPFIGHLLIAAILLSPLIVSNFWLFFMGQMVVASYVAVSFNLAYSYGRILSFGQGAFFGVGAYIALYLASESSWSLPLIVIVTLLVTAVIGAVSGAIFVRMGGHNPTIATVILASAALLAANALGQYTGSEDGLGLKLTAVGLGSVKIPIGPTTALYYAAAVPLVALVVAWQFFQHKDFWKVARAVASNEVRAQQLGYNVKLRRIVVFAVSAVVAGMGGIFYALLMQHVSSTVFDIALSVNSILYAVVGGVGPIIGPILGVFIIYPLTEIIAHYFLYVQIVIGSVLIFTAIAMPKGVLGTLYSRVRGDVAR